MTRRPLPLILFLSMATAAQAQDALTPTDVLDFAEFSVTSLFQFARGQGTLKNTSIDLDLETNAYQVEVDAAVGLGMGFEVELVLPTQMRGTLESDGTFLGFPAETHQNNNGFGDLQIHLIYRLLKEDAQAPQWIVGVIGVAPSGNDNRGDAEIKLGGFKIQSEDDGGLGQGVWKYGAETAISKRLGILEPYLGANYIFGGTRQRNGVREERADTVAILAGAEIHVSPEVTLDLRGLAQWQGQDITEENGSQRTENTHWQYTAQAQLYYRLGLGFTLVLGGGVIFLEDHLTDQQAGTKFEDGFGWYIHAGLHFYFSH